MYDFVTRNLAFAKNLNLPVSLLYEVIAFTRFVKK